MWYASYDSAHWSFEACGSTKIGAEAALILGLCRHGRQYNLDRKWFDPGDIVARRIEPGKCYRDYESI